MRGDGRLRIPDGGDGALNQIGRRLDERRRQLKLTQYELCARLEEITGGRWRPTRQYLYKIVEFTRSVTEIEIFALSEALECDVVWLLLGDRSSTDVRMDMVKTWRESPLADAMYEEKKTSNASILMSNGGSSE